MFKLVWKTRKVYNRKIISQRIDFIQSNMIGLLPLCCSEKNKIEKYSEKHHIPVQEMVSLRTLIKTQKEINYGKYYKINIEKTKKNFLRIIQGANIDYNIKLFFINSKLSTNVVIKTIQKMPEYKSLSQESIIYIDKLKNKIHHDETNSKKSSENFEISLEKYLNKIGISFRNEKQIRFENNYNVTPDILLDEPLVVIANGQEYEIKWMDAKNYILVDIDFIKKSLIKQAEKYNKVFGMGAFVFHYGIDASVNIPNVLLLDGSFLL